MHPIESLSGKTTADGWIIGAIANRTAPGSGGHFSIGYFVTHPDGREGYLKALDFRSALASSDAMRELQVLFNSYVFERDVLSLCTGSKFDKVVVALGHGEIDAPGAPLDKIWYLVFELADGDTSCQSNKKYRRDSSWRLKCLHHISVALSQLHSKGIFHQDLRPSNILVFDKTNTSKVADLGRSHCTTIASPVDDYDMPGMVRYAPLEQVYGYQLPDRVQGRKSADLYLFGSMLFFMFTGVMVTPIIVGNLQPPHRPRSWAGSYTDLVPYILEAQRQAVKLFEVEVAQECDEKTTTELVFLLKSLIEPKPENRGHPDARRLVHGDRFSISRYSTALDRLSKAQALYVRTQNAAIAAE